MKSLEQGPRVPEAPDPDARLSAQLHIDGASKAPGRTTFPELPYNVFALVGRGAKPTAWLRVATVVASNAVTAIGKARAQLGSTVTARDWRAEISR